MKLSQLKPKESSIISEVKISSEKLVQRLSDLGLQKGQKITCLHHSPLGGSSSFQLSQGIFVLEDYLLEEIYIEKGRG